MIGYSTLKLYGQVLINSNEHVDPVTKELQDMLKQSKNEKVPGSGNINMKLIKCTPNSLIQIFAASLAMSLINGIWP
jgi:hypothetical protein